MTPDDFTKAFKDAYPRAVDFADYEHDQMAEEVALIATDQGYRLAGYRLARAVYTTKSKIKGISLARRPSI